MPVCPLAARSARYPSDLDDSQRRVLEPEARAVMAELTRASGRPMVHELRAVFYVVKNGIEWRALPADFLSVTREAVYAFFERWHRRGLPEALVHRLREKLRVRQGRGAQPTASIMDSQIVKAADTVGKASSGYHGGKKITGRGRHVAVDAEGWLLALAVTAASVSDRAGAKLLVIRLLNVVGTPRIMWADSGYDGAPLAAWIKKTAGITIEVVKRSDPHAFHVVRRRWAAVERTFGWLMRCRRLVRDYERLTAHHEAMVYWAHRVDHDPKTCPLPGLPEELRETHGVRSSVVPESA